MHVVLIGGLWLDTSVWDNVLAQLVAAQRMPVSPVELPVRTPTAAPATLDNQLNAVLAAIDSRPEPAVIVGHSAAAALAWLAADRRPEHVARTVLIGGVPRAEGQQYAPFFSAAEGVIPFPGWAAFEGPDSEDLTEDQKQGLQARAIPVPDEVARGIVTYTTEARFEIPTVMVCPEYSPADAERWISSGDVPELTRAAHLSYEDIDSGHWPMLTRPVELAEIIGRYSR